MAETDNQTHKLTDEEFIAIYVENGGLPTKTARAIRAKYKINYSRQSVSERAKNFPEVAAECHSELVELAEDNLRHLLKCDNLAEKRKITIYVLNCLGKKRGFGKNGVDENPKPMREQIIKIGDQVLRFLTPYHG